MGAACLLFKNYWTKCLHCLSVGTSLRCDYPSRYVIIADSLALLFSWLPSNVAQLTHGVSKLASQWYKIHITSYSSCEFPPVVLCSVFSLCSSLHCGRVTMHINLFLSLALNNTSWLVWYKFVLFDVRQAELTASNGYCLLSRIHATSIKENANFVV